MTTDDGVRFIISTVSQHKYIPSLLYSQKWFALINCCRCSNGYIYTNLSFILDDMNVLCPEMLSADNRVRQTSMHHNKL